MKSNKTLLSLIVLSTFALSACGSYSSSNIVDDQDIPADQREYVGPGGMKEYKKEKDKEFKKKQNAKCQDAQIDLAQAQVANDKVAQDRAQKNIEQACAESIKNKQSQEKAQEKKGA